MNKIVSRVLAVVFTAVFALPATGLATGDSRTWSIVAHFRYAGGFEYDYIFARGVSTQDLAPRLAECGQGHQGGPAIWFHCYPLPE